MKRDLNPTEHAINKINRFLDRFDKSYIWLLHYAAKFSEIRVEYLVDVHRNFLQEDFNIPWVAIVDLLLSDLCSQSGYELYVMDESVKEYLNAKLDFEMHNHLPDSYTKITDSYKKFIG